MSKNEENITLVIPLAPEEVTPGIFVTVHEVTLECPILFWCLDASTVSAEKIVRLPCKPCDAGTPYQVKAVCLPYVFAVAHDGAPSTFDLRREKLVRLDGAFAKRVWTALRSRERGNRKKKRKDVK